MQYISKYITSLFLITGTTFCPGCYSSPQSENRSTSEKVSSLEFEIEYLKSLIELLQDETQELREKYYNLFDKVSDLEIGESIKEYALFDLRRDTSGFQTITNDLGSFHVSLQKATPELAGYKLTFSIGNPSLATYKNVKLKIKWNRSVTDYWKWEDPEYKKKIDKYEKDYENYLQKTKDGANFIKAPEYPWRPTWDEACKEREFSTLKDLKPGIWNLIEVHVTPAQLEELGHIELRLEAPVVSLNN